MVRIHGSAPGRQLACLSRLAPVVRREEHLACYACTLFAHGITYQGIGRLCFDCQIDSLTGVTFLPLSISHAVKAVDGLASHTTFLMIARAAVRCTRRFCLFPTIASGYDSPQTSSRWSEYLPTLCPQQLAQSGLEG